MRWRSDKWHWQLETRSAFTRLAHLHEMGTGVEKVRKAEARSEALFFTRRASRNAIHHRVLCVAGNLQNRPGSHLSAKQKGTHDMNVCVEKSSREQTPR